MTRKKSRPHHRETAAAVPPNEGGFYKMFWNSMETSPGNEQNSPQMDLPVRSPAVIIINDSPADSPCAFDENNCENSAVPMPIKEELNENVVGLPERDSHTEMDSSSNFQESHSRINGDCLPESPPTCLPGNVPSSDPSINRTPFSSNQTDLNSVQTVLQSEICANFPIVSTSANISSTDNVSAVCENSLGGEEHRSPIDGLATAAGDQVCNPVSSKEQTLTAVNGNPASDCKDNTEPPEEVSPSSHTTSNNFSKTTVGSSEVAAACSMFPENSPTNDLASSKTPASGNFTTNELQDNVHEECNFTQQIAAVENQSNVDVVPNSSFEYSPIAKNNEEILQESSMDVSSSLAPPLLNSMKLSGETLRSSEPLSPSPNAESSAEILGKNPMIESLSLAVGISESSSEDQNGEPKLPSESVGNSNDSSGQNPADKFPASPSSAVENLIALKAPHGGGIPEFPLENEQHGEETTEETPVDDFPEPPSPALSEGTGQALNLLKSLLNASEEELENFNLNLSEGPDDGNFPLFDSIAEPEGNVLQLEELQQANSPSNINHSSSMEVDESLQTSENTRSFDCDMVATNDTLPNQSNVMNVDAEDIFPMMSNFLPSRIKIDSIGVLRSVRILKDEVRALHKEYLLEDVLLRTASAPPVQERVTERKEVEEPVSFSELDVPLPICCVKMERLPDPFVAKRTIVMSDDTFRTWKRQIIRQRNEEKFRDLKVWRRGRTRLWRECELAGMDRASYDEQVAYIKKHKLNEDSSSDSDSGSERSENEGPFHRSDSSEESSSDSEISSINPLSPPMRATQLNMPSNPTPHNESTTEVEKRSSEDEYVVERSLANKTSATVTPSALRITIRKASMTKSDEDRNDEAENFIVPNQPIVGRSRKIATKRTYRKPDASYKKADATSKSSVAETKKSKNSHFDDEHLYDQSLLGTRSHEVENFNLLEKWDIPFEEPTLFRSPRVASKVAQQKTKEAFATNFKRPQKSAVPTITLMNVSKDVKELVETLVNKTVEAMLFPDSKTDESKSSEAHGASNFSSSEVSSAHTQPEVSSVRIPVPSDETAFDESSEFSQSETNSTIDASSDFGGSTTSLVSEDLQPVKHKSPQKPRKRRRMGTPWSKKKKGKDKGFTEHPVEKPLNEKSVSEAAASPVHSTQVPVVSEGPGQSPYGSEDDSAHRKNQPKQDLPNQTDSPLNNRKTSGEQTVMSVVPFKDPPANKRGDKEVIPPRLTRSKQPNVELDPEPLENFGRRRKRKTDLSDEVFPEYSEEHELPKKEAANKTRKRKSFTPGLPKNLEASRLNISGEPSSMSERQADNSSLNTQVPEVSEGPGEKMLESEEKVDSLEHKKDELQGPQVRVLRSRARASLRTPNTALKDETDFMRIETQQAPTEGSTGGKDGLKEGSVGNDEPTMVLESPQSPTPETVEPDPLINIRITRSKKRRSGPAYVSVKSTTANSQSVCGTVDSLATQSLPVPTAGQSSEEPSTVTEKIHSLGALTSVDDAMPRITGNNHSARENEQLVQMKEGSSSISEQNKSTPVGLVSGSVNEPTTVESQSLLDKPNQSETGTGEIPSTSNQLNNAENSGSAAYLPADDSQIGSPSMDKGVEVESGRLEVLDTLKNILAVTTSPKKARCLLSNANSLASPSVNPANSLVPPSPINTQPSGNNPSVPAVLDTSSLPSPSGTTQNIANALPGTLLPPLSYLNSSLDADLARISNEINDSTIISLADTPGDLVVDELTLEDLNDLIINDSAMGSDGFSDDDTNNGDLADKIDKIVREQMYQEATPLPSQKPKDGNSSNGGSKIVSGVPLEESTAENVKNSSTLNRRESIDERTGLPNTLIQRLRDPRIRSKVLSQLEEVEASKENRTPSAGPSIASLLGKDASKELVAELRSTKGSLSDSCKSIDGVNEPCVPSTLVGSCQGTPVHVSGGLTKTLLGADLETPTISGSTTQPTQPLAPGTPVELPLAKPGTPLLPTGSIETQLSDEVEQPPDPSKVDFLVPPSDDEEEESLKRRPKKAKKEVDAELMYKSPLEDLQSEARPAYGDRAPRRYPDNFNRRRLTGDGRSRWDDSTRSYYERRSRRDEQTSYNTRPSRDRSRDRRFDEHPRDQSRDRRYFYDRPLKDHSMDCRPYGDSYSRREDWETPHPMDVFNHPPRPLHDSAVNHHPGMMIPPEPMWRQNYYPDPNVQANIQMFLPEPPKINHMETRLINLELLPKTTNLDVPPIKKVYSYFDKDNVQVLPIPSPTYDPKEQAHTISMMDPIYQEMVDIIQLPRPTSGLTGKYFGHIPPNLSLDDVVKFHYISPAYVMVPDFEGDPLPASDDEDDNDDSEAQTKLDNDPLTNILRNLPLLKEQYSLQNSKPLVPPPAPGWNDVDLRVPHSPHTAKEELTLVPGRNPSPPSCRAVEKRSRSPYRSRRSKSRSPRRRHRSRSNSSSDMSISPTRSRSRSPAYHRRRSKSPRRRRSISRSSERSWRPSTVL